MWGGGEFFITDYNCDDRDNNDSDDFDDGGGDCYDDEDDDDDEINHENHENIASELGRGVPLLQTDSVKRFWLPPLCVCVCVCGRQWKWKWNYIMIKGNELEF